VDPALVKLFNDGAAKAKAGDNVGALATYRDVLQLQSRKKLAAAPRFLATVHLHLSYALMDLKRMAEAEAELKTIDPVVFKAPQRYDYYFSLGNALGRQRKVRPMFAAFVEAISASEDAQDMDVRPAQCWSKILGYTLLAEDWPYLAEVSEKALQVARVRGWKKLQEEAVVGQTEARNHLRASGKPGSPAAAAQPGSPGAGLPGGYTMNELANVVGAQANAFRACYETALAKEPTLAGRFKYRILLDAGRINQPNEPIGPNRWLHRRAVQEAELPRQGQSDGGLSLRVQGLSRAGRSMRVRPRPPHKGRRRRRSPPAW
jgi:tetratricopeptide (TPR) repeat protein